MLRGVLLVVLMLAPAAQALTLGVDVGGTGAKVDSNGGQVDVDVQTPATPDTTVSLPIPLPSLPLQVVSQPPPPAEPAPGTARDSAQPLPPEVAAPAAAGGVAALGLLAWAVLRAGLAGLPLGHLFSRIQGPRVLEHPTRAHLNQIVAERPGLSQQELQVAAALAWGTTLHHLRRLERNGLIVSEVQGGRHRYFPANSEASRNRAGLALVSQPTAQRIALLVSQSPGRAQDEICQVLGLRGPAASKHLARFEKNGLVTVVRDGRHRRYNPTLQMHAVLGAAA